MLKVQDSKDDEQVRCMRTPLLCKGLKNLLTILPQFVSILPSRSKGSMSLKAGKALKSGLWSSINRLNE